MAECICNKSKKKRVNVEQELFYGNTDMVQVVLFLFFYLGKWLQQLTIFVWLINNDNGRTYQVITIFMANAIYRIKIYFSRALLKFFFRLGRNMSKKSTIHFSRIFMLRYLQSYKIIKTSTIFVATYHKIYVSQ